MCLAEGGPCRDAHLDGAHTKAVSKTCGAHTFAHYMRRAGE